MTEGEVGRLDRRGFSLARPTRLADTPGTGHLRAGATGVDLTPALGLDTAGFGFISSRHTSGVFGRLRATLLLVEDADGSRVLFIACDLLAGTRYLAEALAQQLGPELGLGVDRIWLGASHTHSGPGHIFGERFYDCLAARTNDFDLDLASWLVDRLAAGAREAAERLQPARVGIGSAPLWGMVWNRSLLALLANFGEPSWMRARVRRDHARGVSRALNGAEPPEDLQDAHAASDSRVQVIWAESVEGEPLGVLGILHATPSVLPAHLALLSPDAVGVATRRVMHALARSGSGVLPVGMLGGSMGDTNLVAPGLSVGVFRDLRAAGPPLERREDLVDLTERVGRHLAAGLLRACAVARTRASADRRVEVRFEELHIPAARGPGWELPERHQVGNAQFGGSELNRPREPMIGTWWSLLTAPTLARLVMRWLVGEPSGRRSRWWWPVPVRLPVWGDDRHSPKNYVLYDILRSFGRRFYGRNLRAGDAFDPHLPIRHVRLGDDELVGLPVEPSAVLTQRIRAALRPDAPEEIVLVGLCGGYAGYATTSDEYRVQDYEGAATLWGRDFGRYVQAMVERVASGSARPPGMTLPGEASFDTDPREAGSPISLHVPPRAMQPFTGTPEVTLGILPPGARRLTPFEEPSWSVSIEGDPELLRLAADVASDAERLLLWGWWFSEPPSSTERAVPLAEGWIVRIEHRGEDGWQDLCWGPCVVDDRDVSFFLRRAVSADLTRVRWIMSVRLPCGLLPDGTEVRLRVADRPGIRPLEGSIVRSWTWSREGDGVLEGG